MTRTLLVNKDNKIKDNYLTKVKLVETIDSEGNKIYIEEETYNNYLKLKEFLESKKINICINSAYRSIEEQQALYEEYKEKYGEEYANKTVANPGVSEHHTGLAIDFGIILENKPETEEEKDKLYAPIYKEIHKCLHNYGFILRYPEEKENITGYPYEPWHIRYVGKFVANIMYENNYTLEEYLTLYSGIVLINKEKNMTSFDVVNKISKLFGIKRVGHTGTLDPLATGVLIVTIGQATKVVELITASYKEYIAEVKLGVKTDTLDITGKIIDTKPVSDNIPLLEVLNSYKKTYLQEVPIYSAVKVNGKKLYEYARKNEKVELPKKEVTIKEIELLSQLENTFTFKTLVSKGCYIRSLINDIGKSLNTYAIMTELTRTKQGKISIEQTNTMSNLNEELLSIYRIEDILDIPIIEVDEFIERKIATGQKIENIYSIKDKVLFKNKNSQILGIYEVEKDILKVWKNFR